MNKDDREKVEYLTKLVKEKRDDRDLQKAKGQREVDVLKLIGSTPDEQLTDFWCESCSKDVTTLGRKQVRTPVGLDPLPFAYFEAICNEGHKVIRYITDKIYDPYYRDSEMISDMRNRMADDLLTPDDPRFRKLYGDPEEKLKALMQS